MLEPDAESMPPAEPPGLAPPLPSLLTCGLLLGPLMFIIEGAVDPDIDGRDVYDERSYDMRLLLDVSVLDSLRVVLDFFLRKRLSMTAKGDDESGVVGGEGSAASRLARLEPPEREDRGLRGLAGSMNCRGCDGFLPPKDQGEDGRRKT